jgi:two-component SAPR family response regulator
MKQIILCSSNPILVKSLYGLLRDEGHAVETIEHPSFAVQLIMQKQYDFLIIDSEPFGLSAEDAAEIVKTIAPLTRILFIGRDAAQADDVPLDLEEFRKRMHRIAV